MRIHPHDETRNTTTNKRPIPRKEGAMHYRQILSHPDIFEIRVPFRNFNTSFTNCYVVKSEGDVLVIDTGAPTEEGFTLLSLALNELHVDLSKISFFLTHLHLDHAGLLSRIAPESATVYLSSLDYDYSCSIHASDCCEYLRDRLSVEGASPSEIRAYTHMQHKRDLFKNLKPSISFVQKGDCISIGRYRFTVLETAGHTPGHISLYEPESHVLFSGDHILLNLSPSIGLFPSKDDGFQTYLDSLAEVIKLPPHLLLPAHGDSCGDFSERIIWLVAHHQKRLEEAHRIIAAAPNSIGLDVIGSIAWNVPFSNWENIPLPQRCCILGEGISILDHLTCAGRIARAVDDRGLHRYRAL